MKKSYLDKILTINQLTGILNQSYRSAHRIAFTNGCFDILHRGHIHYLSSAREKSDILIVGLNSDESVRRLKGVNRPVNDQQARAEVLASLLFVDHVIIFDEDTPINLINTIHPDLLIKGGDYKPEDIVGFAEVNAYGGKVLTIPLLEGYSSSDIIDRML